MCVLVASGVCVEKAIFGAYAHILPVCYYWIMEGCSEHSCGGAEKYIFKKMPDEKMVCSNLHRNVSLGKKKSLSFSLLFLFSPFI